MIYPIVSHPVACTYLPVGSVPESFGRLHNLKELDLGGNRLSGALPASLANCTALLDLQLWSNELVSEIPDSYSQLINLQYVTCLSSCCCELFFS